MVSDFKEENGMIKLTVGRVREEGGGGEGGVEKVHKSFQFNCHLRPQASHFLRGLLASIFPPILILGFSLFVVHGFLKQEMVRKKGSNIAAPT